MYVKILLLLSVLASAVCAADFSLGERYKDFVVTKSVDIQELQCHLTELTHEPTGAHVAHIAADDPENFFSIAFLTPSTSSKGEAHVLEHTVLTGSEAYPTELYFAMRRRSVHSFMNAATGDDYTYYPVASCVEKDFYNLFSVYFDAVFHPLLRGESIAQEGCRLEFETPDDPSSPLVYKGVVYNEMKGVMSVPENLLTIHLEHELYKDTPYRYMSGGDPQELRTLTRDDVVTFHRAYYHPANCLFFFYGDIPLEKHLDVLAEKDLCKLPQKPPLTPMPKQPSFSEPVKKCVPYPAHDSADKPLLVFSWLVDNRFDLSILDACLMDSDASPLKQKLLQSGICTQAKSSYDTRKVQSSYSIELLGCTVDPDTIEQVLFDALKEVQKEGITDELVEIACHQFELGASEIRGRGEPFGLTLFTRAAYLRCHGRSLESGLTIRNKLEKLKREFAENPHHFSNLIDTYFIQNAHMVRISLEPDVSLQQKQFDEEKEKMRLYRNSLSVDEVHQIVEQSLKLKDVQKASACSHILPESSLAEVPLKLPHYPLEHFSVGGLDLFCHKTYTNRITYVDLLFDLPEVSGEDLWQVQLFTTLLPEVGCGGKTARETLRYVQKKTSPLSCTIAVRQSVEDTNQFSPLLRLYGYALDKNGEALFSLLYDMATSASFSDKARLKELILQQYTDLASKMSMNGLLYAESASLAPLSQVNAFQEKIGGLDYFYNLQHLVEHFDDEVDKLSKKLQELQQKLFCSPNVHLVISCEESTLERYKEMHFGALPELPRCAYSPFTASFDEERSGFYVHPITSQVANTAVGCNIVPLTHPKSPYVALASHLFTNTVLHKRIREEGGAYGGGARYNVLSGNFLYYSYRDPHIASTLNAFQEAVKRGMEGDFSEDAVKEAKLQRLNELFKPIAPGRRGFVSYLRFVDGLSDGLLDNLLYTVVHATHEDIKNAVQQQLAPLYKECVCVTLAPSELIEKEKNLLPVPSYA